MYTYSSSGILRWQLIQPPSLKIYHTIHGCSKWSSKSSVRPTTFSQTQPVHAHFELCLQRHSSYKPFFPEKLPEALVHHDLPLLYYSCLFHSCSGCSFTKFHKAKDVTCCLLLDMRQVHEYPDLTIPKVLK